MAKTLQSPLKRKERTAKPKTQIQGQVDMPFMLLTVLLCVASLCVSILQIYLSCSIGHLFRRRRILFSILFYYAINIAVEFFSLLLIVGIVGTSVIDQLLWMNHGENILLAVLLVAEIALGCVYFFVSERLLRRHLNLE